MITSMIQPMITGMITSMIRSSVTGRWFISLDPVANSYYEISSTITPSGNFTITGKFSTTDAGTRMIILDGADAVDNILIEKDTSNNIRFLATVNSVGQTAISSTGTFNAGKLHSFTASYTGTTAELIIDEVSQGTETWALDATQTIKYFGQLAAGSNWWDGILSDIGVNDAGTPTTFELNEPTSNTESSVEGNNTVTYNNISAGIREFFTLVDDGVNWLGGELVTNGGFDSDTGWTVPASASISGGVCTFTSSNAEFLTRSITFSAGVTYRAQLSMDYTSGGGFRLPYDGDVGNITTFGESGLGSHVFLSPGGSTLFIAFASAYNGSIDDVSVKRLIQIA